MKQRPYASRRFVLLDRDGTINVERDYLDDPDEVELIAGAACGLHRLRESGLGLVVVTNQSGIGRGYFDEGRLQQIHDRLRALLSAEGVELDAIYVCPHAPEEQCDCRKPKPGMVRQASGEFGFDPRWAFVVGDKACDIEMGRAVGATTLLVRSGCGAETERKNGTDPDYVVDDLWEAAEVIERIVGK